MRIVRRWMMGYSAFPFPFRRFNNREVEHGKRKEKLRSKQEDRIRRKAASLLLDRMFNRVQSSIQSNSILFSWGGGDIIRLASVHKSRGEGRRANRCAIRDLGNSGFRIRTRFRNYPFSLSLSTIRDSNRWTEPRCPTRTMSSLSPNAIRLWGEDIDASSPPSSTRFEIWPNPRRIEERKRKRYAQTSGKIIEDIDFQWEPF